MITSQEEERTAQENLSKIALRGSTRTTATTGLICGQSHVWHWNRYGQLSCSPAILKP